MIFHLLITITYYASFLNTKDRNEILCDELRRRKLFFFTFCSKTLTNSFKPDLNFNVNIFKIHLYSSKTKLMQGFIVKITYVNVIL